MNLTAYYFDKDDLQAMPIVPAPSSREWMAKTWKGYARRCLPLLIANQVGWWILNPSNCRAVWNGGDAVEDLQCVGTNVNSTFGYGIITFQIPYLFRTSEGWQLWAKGPANYPKIGVQALEGIVETDWSHHTFTMNWKFTRPGVIEFSEGEPICQIIPIQLTDLERAKVSLERIPAKELELYRQAKERREATRASQVPNPEEWEGTYFRGEGKGTATHRTKLNLDSFQPLEVECRYENSREQ